MSTSQATVSPISTNSNAGFTDELRVEIAGVAELPSEFFAVTSEVFFEDPLLLRQEYPEVYRQLALFYRQDPAA